jgi:hypothetical protein
LEKGRRRMMILCPKTQRERERERDERDPCLSLTLFALLITTLDTKGQRRLLFLYPFYHSIPLLFPPINNKYRTKYPWKKLGEKMNEFGW